MTADSRPNLTTVPADDMSQFTVPGATEHVSELEAEESSVHLLYKVSRVARQ